MKQMGWNWLLVLLLGAAFLVIQDQERKFGQLLNTSAPATSTLPRIEDPRADMNRDNMLIRFNEARLEAGLKGVWESTIMNEWAQKRAENACTPEGQPSHDGFREWRKKGLNPGYWGEILAGGVLTPAQAMDGWRQSPTHWNIILGADLQAIGIGIHKIENGYCVAILQSAVSPSR